MQVSALSAQSSFGSELVDWYRDATSVTHGHLLVGFSPRTDDRLLYCTNTRSNPWTFYIPERLKRLKSLDDEQRKFIYSRSVPVVFPQVPRAFRSVLSKRVYPVPVQVHRKSAQKKPAKHEQTTPGKIFKPGLVSLSKENNLEAKKKLSSLRKKAYSSWNLSLSQSLIIWLDMKEFVFLPASVYEKSLNTHSLTKQELPKYQPLQNRTCQIDSIKKGMNKKLFIKADSLVDKNFVLSSCQAFKFAAFIAAWCKKWSFTINLCWETASWKRRRSRRSLYLTWRCWRISNSYFESECQSQRETKLAPFQNMNFRSCEDCTQRVVLRMALCAI